MRRQRKKYAARNEAARGRRDAWLLAQPKCVLCVLEATRGERKKNGVKKPAHAHHIASRNAAARDEIYEKQESPANWLACCLDHHYYADANTPETCRAVWRAKQLLNAHEFDGRLLAELAPGKFGALARAEGLIH